MSSFTFCQSAFQLYSMMIIPIYKDFQPACFQRCLLQMCSMWEKKFSKILSRHRINYKINLCMRQWEFNELEYYLQDMSLNVSIASSVANSAPFDIKISNPPSKIKMYEMSQNMCDLLLNKDACRCLYSKIFF